MGQARTFSERDKTMNTITLNVANRIIESALDRGRELNLKPLSVAVLDAGGHLIAFQKQDGSSMLRFEIAFGKAYGALGVNRPSRVLEEGLSSRPGFQNSLAVTADGKFIPAPGGVLVCIDGGDTIIGAVGISGDTSNKDEYCAIEGIRAAGLVSLPFDPAPGWPST